MESDSSNLHVATKRLVHFASAEGNLESLTFLADNGCNLNAQTSFQFLTPLSVATTRNQFQVIKFLLSRGADVNVLVGKNNENKRSVFHEALLYGGFDEIFQELLRSEDISSHTLDLQDLHGDTVLNTSAEEEDEEAVRMLLEAGADVNIPDTEGDTPLMRAATNGNYKIAEMLIEHGAHLDLINDYKETALIIAADQGISLSQPQ